MRQLTNLLYTLKVIFNHPLAVNRRVTAVRRWLSWQIGSRLVPGPVVVPFVNQAKLIVAPGMHGATLNLYVGLSEFSDMSFLLHFLRPGECFVDIGANVGVYTVLASQVVGCKTFAFEPTPQVFEHLQANVRLNGIAEIVKCYPVALGEVSGTINFTIGLDTLNHVAATLPPESSALEFVEVEMTTLDQALAQQEPTLIKIDVEGYEASVITGGEQTLAQPSLKALIVEINENCTKYSVEREATFEKIIKYGFSACRYEPRRRQLLKIEKESWRDSKETNTIFVRDFQASKERVKTADRFRVLGDSI